MQSISISADGQDGMDDHHSSGAAEAFFDHFGLDPGAKEIDLLYGFTAAFSVLPWENLTKYLSRIDGTVNRMRMPDTVVFEHISKGTGGTCFSLTETVRKILSAADLSVRPAMADMQHGPGIHCAALVELPGGCRYLIDPGYLVPEPVRLNPGSETILSCGNETLVYRPAADGRSWDMYTRTGQDCIWRYRIRTDPITAGEFREFWVRSFDAPGMNSLHINRRMGGSRLYAHNENLRIQDPAGKRNEKLRTDYADRVEELFGISRDVAARAWEELVKSRCR
jgi:arylamine N-acetyltransferase